MEQYERWEDAEQFFLPEFEEEIESMDGEEQSFSEPAPTSERQENNINSNNITSGPADLSQMLLSKLNFKRETETASIESVGSPSGPGSRTSSRSSRTSPECAQHENGNGNGNTKSGKTKSGHQRTASGSTIPVAPPTLRPLLSALLWRLHGQPDSANAARGCILVTNDRATQVWAQKFGIGVKNILQLRTAIQYEEREYKNRCKYVEKTQAQPAEPKTLLSYEEDSDEDELVFVPRGGGAAAGGSGGERGRGKGNHRGSKNNSRKSTKNTPAPAPTTSTATPTTTETAIEVPTQPIDPNSFSRSLGPNKTPTVDLSTQQGSARNISGASRRPANGGRRGGSGRGAARGNARGRGKLWVP